MKKLFVVLIATILVNPGLFANNSESQSLKDEIQLLKQKLMELEQRMQVQADETDRLKVSNVTLTENQAMAIDAAAAVETDRRMYLNRLGALQEINDRVSIGGNIDILGYSSDFNRRDTNPAAARNEDTSDVILDQVRLELGIDVSENVSATIALLYEDYQPGAGTNIGGGAVDTERDGDLQVDEAYITLNNDRGCYLIAGRQYFDFTNVGEAGNFINDSLVRQFGETRDSGITIGHKTDTMDFNVFAFNGWREETQNRGGTDNKIDTWGASLSLDGGDEEMSYNFGASYISNLFQAQNTAAVAGFDGALGGAGNPYTDSDVNDAYSIHGVLSMGSIWLSAEYVAALDDINGGAKDREPSATTIELAMACPMNDHEYTVALKWETNNDQDTLDNTTLINNLEEVWGVGISSNIYENTKLTLNYENQSFGGRNTLAAASTGHANLYMAELSISF